MRKTIYNLVAENIGGDKLIAFDVGAKEGVFEPGKIGEFLQYYGFEPNPEEFKKLKRNERVEYFPFALGKKEEIKNFNITRHASYSSFLHLNPSTFMKHFGLMKQHDKWVAGMQIEKTIPVKVKTIDQVLIDSGVNRVDFLKMDTQGTELDILKGATNALRHKKIGVIFSEFSFIEIYQNQNLFSDLELYLKEFEYECIDCRFYPNSVVGSILSGRKGVVEQPRYSVGGDAVFIPIIDHSVFKQQDIFKIGLLTAQLGYLSVAKHLFQYCDLDNKEIISLLRNMQYFNLKKMGLELIPPLVYKSLKAIMHKL